MDVSDIHAEPGGQELIDTVVSLTELPDPLVREELDQILQLSGKNSEEVTLDELRKAMLIYLESLQSGLLDEEDPHANG
jgi:hypothetical protein